MVRRMMVTAAALAGLGGCAGGTGTLQVPEGAPSPDEAVVFFMRSAQEAQAFRGAGELMQADRAYERMAGVFGTEKGSIVRFQPAGEVRDRMIVLAACLRPDSFRKLSEIDPRAARAGATTVTVELSRGGERVTLPFYVVRGREDRWFVKRIDFSSFSC